MRFPPPVPSTARQGHAADAHRRAQTSTGAHATHRGHQNDRSHATDAPPGTDGHDRSGGARGRGPARPEATGARGERRSTFNRPQAESALTLSARPLSGPGQRRARRSIHSSQRHARPPRCGLLPVTMPVTVMPVVTGRPLRVRPGACPCPSPAWREGTTTPSRVTAARAAAGCTGPWCARTR